VPPTGHAFTCLAHMRGKYENCIQQDDLEKHMWSIWTEPNFAIGERAVFLETPAGNILWDCIANLDQKTVDFIKDKGGLKAMVVSHPHFWTTVLDWAQEFDCPLYLASDEAGWLCREDKEGRTRWIQETSKEIVPGVTAVKLGGHFPGSMILHWDGKIFTADTIAVTLASITAPCISPDFTADSTAVGPISRSPTRRCEHVLVHVGIP
jgi:glyoxylase-like metal-dependent hydrolase (beta-lactamase superfamily II)